MKFRAIIPACGLLLLLFATTGVKGCREEAARTFNPNRAPDTYLTAAPIESTSTNYLFHMYWTGTDPDGEVVGFYIAVTDSNIEPHPDSLVWTTRTDTNIAFKVAGTTQTLSHRFYVTAVDNEGREDPSPAWVYFEAFDRFFPEPIFLEAYAVEYLSNGTQNVFTITDNEAEFGIRDTIPIVNPPESDSVVVYFKWTGIDRDRFGVVTGYRYRMTGDAGYTDIMGADTASARYRNLGNGVRSFELAALDDAGAQTDPDSVRVFVSNFDPDVWYADSFIERRAVEGGTLIFEQGAGDTVAIGSILQFTVFGADRDGDDELLQYSYSTVSKKACGGGAVPPYSFFDKNNPGPSYGFSIQLSKEPRESGFLRTRIRVKDEHGRIDGSPAELPFYSNLPPEVPNDQVRLNDIYTIDSDSVQAVAGAIVVTIEGAVDPDPGNGEGELEAQVLLIGIDNEYSALTDWVPASSAIVLSGISQTGLYDIAVRIRDEGCRQLNLDREIVITL